MKQNIKVFISAFLAGVCISVGGVVFLQLKDAFPGGNVAGALLFTVGLYTICTRGLHLFTGKVCYVFDNDFNYLLQVGITWVGNLCGTCLSAAMVNASRLTVSQTALALSTGKLNDNMISLAVLGFFCNICIFIAVNAFANNPHEIGKYVALFLGVAVFILAGFEHSVADMFYFAVSGVLYTSPVKTLAVLLVISLGNAVGGVFFPLLEKIKNK